MTGSRLHLLALTALFVLLSQTQVIHSSVEIGAISELRGNAQVLRDKPYGAELEFDIQQMDDVRTEAGRVSITFEDDSTVKLTEHSKLVIDEYIYDPDPSKSKMALKFASGTARFITGKFNNKSNISIKTPTADIAIRGTDFTCTVDELGRSLVILLPDENGISSGEIVVATAMGSVTLNKPYQATTVSVYENNPSKPVTLDISLDLIDNMLIVNPPEETEQQTEETQSRTTVDYLEFDDLDIDYLNEDFLDAEEELEFTELDVNYLDVNFLEDLLNVLDALAIEKEEDALKQGGVGIRITGTEIGQDKDTQITTIISGQNISLTRTVNQSAKLNLDGSGSYTVILVQDGVSNVVKINGGSSTTITIKQSSG
tara:strand:+ start:128 stop:1243 length:1116 start_codon:yes stop_codon:yes gene_type:complete